MYDAGEHTIQTVALLLFHAMHAVLLLADRYNV